MAILGQFLLVDYTTANGVFRLHFVNHDPGGGNPNDYFVDILETEIPANINQNQLGLLLKERLGWAVNQTFPPLNTFIANGTAVVQP